MEIVTLYVPDEHLVRLLELRTTPFAKIDEGYQFAYWSYELNYNKKDQKKLQESYRGEQAIELFEKAKEDLKKVIVTEDDYLGWTVHKKNAGGVAQYHKIIEDLSIAIIMLAIDYKAEDIAEHAHKNESSLYSKKAPDSDKSTKKILNRHNPFADVTIKSQQFFYKTAEGGTETLFFNTNNIVEKVDKNNKDMITMRPSFSVTKEHGVVQRPMQKVTFANSITEPIIGDEDHIYIHID